MNYEQARKTGQFITQLIANPVYRCPDCTVEYPTQYGFDPKQCWAECGIERTLLNWNKIPEVEYPEKKETVIIDEGDVLMAVKKIMQQQTARMNHLQKQIDEMTNIKRKRKVKYE